MLRATTLHMIKTRCVPFLQSVVLLLVLLVAISGCTPTLQVQNVPAATPTDGEETAAPTEATAFEVPGAKVTEDTLTVIVTYLTFFAEMCGALVIAVAVVRGLLRYLPHMFGHQSTSETFTEGIRLQLGKSLALALEFALAADILKTAVAPTLAVIGQLAAIAALRTFLNYFLDQELRESERRRSAQRGAEQENGAAGSRVYPTKRGDGS
jgi:uncharacterized membrane protein